MKLKELAEKGMYSKEMQKAYKQSVGLETQKPKTPKTKTEIEMKNPTVTKIGRFTITSEGGAYVIHNGPRGGKYLLVKGEKVYLKK